MIRSRTKKQSIYSPHPHTCASHSFHSPPRRLAKNSTTPKRTCVPHLTTQRTYQHNKAREAAKMAEHTYDFNITMTCGGCSGAIERVLGRLEGLSLLPFLYLCFSSPRSFLLRISFPLQPPRPSISSAPSNHYTSPKEMLIKKGGYRRQKLRRFVTKPNGAYRDGREGGVRDCA